MVTLRFISSVIKSEGRSGRRVCVCKLKKIKTLTCLVVDCFERLIDLNYNSYLVRFSISMRGKWCQTIVSQTFKLKIPRRKRFKMKSRITLQKTFGRTNQNKIENNLWFYFLFTGSQENLGNFKNTTSCSCSIKIKLMSNGESVLYLHIWYQSSSLKESGLMTRVTKSLWVLAFLLIGYEWHNFPGLITEGSWAEAMLSWITFDIHYKLLCRN